MSKYRGALLLACAAAAHEVNRAWCKAHGDMSQPPWNEAPRWQRDSALNGVMGVLAGNGPEESHKSWLAEKEAAGWKYGDTKDPDAKTHPCFKPYSELSPEQKAKDALFVNTVWQVAGELGLTKDAPHEGTSGVLADVAEERAAQEVRWGEQNHASGSSNGLHSLDGLMAAAIGDPFAGSLKALCEHADEHGTVTWAHILAEEVQEALDVDEDDDRAALRKELVQVAAVAVAWVECLDRRDAAENADLFG